MSEKVITILHVDDHPMVLKGMKALVETFDNIKIVASVNDSFQAMEYLKNNEVDLVFSDISLPDVNGLDLVKRIHKEYPRLKIMAVTTYNDMGFLTQMIKNGANGYLLKSANIEDIQVAIKVVMSGGTYIDRQLGTVGSDFLSSKVNKNVPFITSREKEVLELISKGMKNQEIANQLFISITTVNSHRNNLLLKFNVSNTAALIRIAVENKLI